nr:hypothetical protein [uncultured Flavobacterium sp.]
MAERSKFNGMEWQPELELNLYDFGAAGNLKHTTYNVSKTLAKSSQVGSVLLQGPDIVNGVIADQGLGRNTATQTAGAVGSIIGGAWLGGKSGALASSYSGNPWVIGIATVAGSIFGGAVGEKGAERLIKAIPENTNRREPVLHKR